MQPDPVATAIIVIGLAVMFGISAYNFGIVINEFLKPAPDREWYEIDDVDL